MAQILLMISVLLFICVLLSHLGPRIGVPSLLLFICLGMLAGALEVGNEFQNFVFAEDFSMIGLIFIIFYGGFGTSWQRAKKTALPAGLLSTVGVFLTAALVMLFCHFVLGMGWKMSLLLGSVISSTDAASVFNILRSKRLNLKYGTASMLELESGSNDPCANIMVLASLALLGGGTNAWEVTRLLMMQFGIGVITGFAVALAAVWIMQHVHTAGSGYGVIFITAAAMCSYALAECLGGNGYLSVYITGIVMGNNAIPDRRALVHFFDGMTGLFQVIIFFLLGLVATPALLIKCALRGLAIAVFITFIARPAAVFAILKPFKAPLNQRLLVDWCGLRGASAIVFAIIAATSPATGPAPDSELFHTVFFIVLFSILLQGSLIPYVTKLLKMTDDYEDVMRTFSDWSEDAPLEFIQIRIGSDHPWRDKLLMEVRPSDVLSGGRVVSVIRDGKQITARGSTRLREGDIAVAVGESLDGENWGTLNELTITPGHSWVGRQIKDLKLKDNCTLVAIRRSGTLFIPDGSAIICADDLIILNES